MSTPEAPNRGPCSAWITADDVAAVCTTLDTSGGTSVYDPYALAASETLYELSGRQFSGLCERTVRPCVPSCGCWPDRWAAAYVWYPVAGYWFGPWGGFGTGSEGRGCCGCLSEVKLAGYPVRQVTEVLIDGAAVDPGDYRLDQNKYLVYLNDTDGNARFWPSCQNLARPDTDLNTFAVTYTYGVNPPEAGLLAALELACQMAAAATGGDCALPPGTVKVTRQGIEVDLLKMGAAFLSLPLVSLFLQTVNPTGARRRAALHTFDGAPFARQVGQ